MPRGLKRLRGYQIRVCRLHRPDPSDAVRRGRKIPHGCQQWSTLRPGRPFEIGDIAVSPFTIPHDAADPVGFVFRAEGVRMGYATDLGYIPPNVKAQLKGVDLLMLESNHDLEMLRDGPYPWQVKQRVLSRVGHLSNEAAAEFLEDELRRSGGLCDSGASL